MLRTLVRMDKMAALRHIFSEMGMLAGTTSSYMAKMKSEDEREEDCSDMAELRDNKRDEDNDGGPTSGNASDAMFNVKLAVRCGTFNILFVPPFTNEL